MASNYLDKRLSFLYILCLYSDTKWWHALDYVLPVTKLCGTCYVPPVTHQLSHLVQEEVSYEISRIAK